MLVIGEKMYPCSNSTGTYNLELDPQNKNLNRYFSNNSVDDCMKE